MLFFFFFFLLFVGLMWVTHLFYLIFIFYFQQKLDKLFLNEHNLLVCVFVCISVISFFKSKQKLGERKKKRITKVVNTIWHGPNGCLFDISSQEPFIFQEHVILSWAHCTQQDFKRKLALRWRKSKRYRYGTESQSQSHILDLWTSLKWL